MTTVTISLWISQRWKLIRHANYLLRRGNYGTYFSKKKKKKMLGMNMGMGRSSKAVPSSCKLGQRLSLTLKPGDRWWRHRVGAGGRQRLSLKASWSLGEAGKRHRDCLSELKRGRVWVGGLGGGGGEPNTHLSRSKIGWGSFCRTKAAL